MDDTLLNDNYDLDASNRLVILHVTIGYAQQGSTTVSINGVPVITGADNNGNYNDSFNLTLGTNANLANALLTIAPAVCRIQDNEPRTSVSILLTGGITSSNYPLLQAEAAEQGDVVDFLALITMQNQ